MAGGKLRAARRPDTKQSCLRRERRAQARAPTYSTRAPIAHLRADSPATGGWGDQRCTDVREGAAQEAESLPSRSEEATHRVGISPEQRLQVSQRRLVGRVPRQRCPVASDEPARRALQPHRGPCPEWKCPASGGCRRAGSLTRSLRSRRAQRRPPAPIRAARRARAGPAVPNGVPSASRAGEGRVGPAVERPVGRRSPLAGRIRVTTWEDPTGSLAATRAQCLPAGIVDHRHGR